MNLNKYFLPLLKWWWLILAATLLGAAASFVATRLQPDMYQARTTLMIGQTINNPNPTNTEFTLGQQLASTYADIAKRQLVRDATQKALGLSKLPQYEAQALTNTQIIEILVNDPNPEIAQKVANELATQLIKLTPTFSQPEEQSRQDFVRERLNSLEVQISQTESEIEKMQSDLGNMDSAKEINDTKTQISGLESKLTSLQSIYSDLLSNTDQGAINTLTVIEPAVLPRAPVGSEKIIAIILATIVGLVLSTGAAFFMEYIDGAIKTSDEVKKYFHTPILGYIYDVSKSNKKAEKQFSIAEHPIHPITETFRAVRTNLEFSNGNGQVKTLLVTSADSKDGKTWVAANLAISFAQEDKKVVLLDADLWNPSVHRFFNLQNQMGLTDLFLGHEKFKEVIKYNNGDKVALITAGDPPENAAEFMSQKKIDQVLIKLREVVDLVIIDGPPFSLADASILASKADAIITVVRPGHTQKISAQVMTDKLLIAGGNLVGVVVNRIPRREMKFYSDYPGSSKSQVMKPSKNGSSHSHPA